MAKTVGVAEGSLPEDALLGRLATFTLPDDPRSGSKLIRAWNDNGLDVDDLPPMRSPVHVFQSACASVRSRRGSGLNKNVEIRADEVENNGVCSYQITRAVWDRSERTIEHEKAMRVSLDKTTLDISVAHLADYGADADAMLAIENLIRKHYKANGSTVPGQKIRNAVRDTLGKIGAQNVRRKAGGLYFVPREWNGPNGREATQPTLDGLRGVLDTLYGDRADFYVIPLANDEGMQAMVRKHFTLNANERSREAAERAWQRVRTAKAGKSQRAIRSDLVTNLYNERRAIAGAISEFKELVNVEEKDLKANLDDLDSALSELEDLREEEAA